MTIRNLVLFLLVLIPFVEVSSQDETCRFMSIVKMSVSYFYPKNLFSDMCINTRLVRNRYTGKLIRVACGKCAACQQKKAALRANRIRNNSMTGYVPLFVTLTYDNMFVPFVRRDELCAGKHINVYRDCSLRWYKGKFIIKNSLAVLDSVLIPEGTDFYGLQDLNGKPNCIGVIYLKDVQDFLKRLRITFLRKYGYQLKLSFFACHEYGGDTYRPHSHLLLYVRQDDAEKTSALVSSCWSYDFRNPQRLRIEVARNAASYVASYVNSGSSFPPLLKTDSFRQRCHQSKSFGVGLHCFTLTELLKKVDSRDLFYSRNVIKDGITRFDYIPVPKYVINRYFPIFKGHCRFTDIEISLLLRIPKILLSTLRRGFNADFTFFGRRYLIHDSYFATKTSFDDLDYHRFIVRMSHAIDFYKSVTGKTEYDFCIDYVRIWNLFNSTILRLSYFDDNGECISDWTNFYENIIDIDNGLVSAPTLIVDDSFERNPNNRFDIVENTKNLESVYNKMSKNKHIVNFALSHQGFNV